MTQRRPDSSTGSRLGQDQRGHPTAHNEGTQAGNGNAIAALVVGLLAVTFAFTVVSALAAVIAGIVALILGALGLRDAKRLGGMYKGLAVSGLVSGGLGLLLGLAVLLGGVTLANQFGDEPEVQQQLDELQQQLDQLAPDVQS